MAYDYTPLANTTKRLIEKYGRPVTFKKFSQVPSDATKPWLGPTTSATEATKTAFFINAEPDSLERMGLSINDVDLLKRSDIKGLVAFGPTDTTDLRTYTELLDIEDSSTYRMQHTQRLRPGTTTMLWVIGASR